MNPAHMPLDLPLPVLVSFAAGLLLFAAVLVGRRYGEVPGSRQWIGALGTAGAWSLVYGAALLVEDPGLRQLFEVFNWFAMVTVVCFLVGAGLKYTGHWSLVYSGWMAGFIGIAGGVGILMSMNAIGIHSLMWTDYTVRSVFGAAGADFRPSLLFFAGVGALYAVMVGTGILVFHTMLRYGSLYRRHAVAVAVALSPVLAANLLWLYNLAVGPAGAITAIAGLDPTPASFAVAAVVSAVGLLSTDLFKTTPATRQIAGHSIFDAIDTGVFVVNNDGLVLGLNDAATGLFDLVDRSDVLAEPWHEVTGVDVTIPCDDPVEVSFPATPNRTHEVSTKPIVEIEAGVERNVGHTVTIQDISRQKRRQQRLEVLNRVLRHNIRNDLTAIKGNAGLIATTVGDVGQDAETPRAGGGAAEDGRDDRIEKVESYVEKIETSSASLSRTAEKARDMSIASPEESSVHPSIALPIMLGKIVKNARREFPDASFELRVPENLSIVTDPDLLEVVVENLVENAVVHNDNDEPRVLVTAERVEDIDRDLGEDGDGAEDGDDQRVDEGVEIVVEDNGPGVPEHELEVLEQEQEEALSHGSGIGLWIIHWAITDLGGEITFETDGEGTTARVILADQREDREPSSRPSARAGGSQR